MRKKQALALCLCFITCYSFFIFNVGASSSTQVIVSSYGSISLSPTPTPAPTPTPSSQNLEPLSAFQAEVDSWPDYLSIDYTVLHSGNPSIKDSFDNDRMGECDGAWLSCKPGDHIYFAVWIKTSAFADSNVYDGGRIGIDFDISPSQGFGIPYDALPSAGGNAPGYPDGDQAFAGLNCVMWNHGEWTLMVIDTYVPTAFYSYVWHGATVIPCDSVQISSLVPWFDVRGWGSTKANGNFVWFADPVFYINP